MDSIIKWKYFFLTSKNRIEEFENDRAILNRQEFSSEVQEIVLKLNRLSYKADYDIVFLSWMTNDSIDWEMANDIASNVQDYTLQHHSFNYLHSLLDNLFSYHNLLPRHQQYSFIWHGYPVELNFEITNYTEYIVYKE